MSFLGTLDEGENVVLVRGDTIVQAEVAAGKTFSLGGDAHLDIHALRGMRGVASMCVNTNLWAVYRADDPDVIPILLNQIFKEVRS